MAPEANGEIALVHQGVVGSPKPVIEGVAGKALHQKTAEAATAAAGFGKNRNSFHDIL